MQAGERHGECRFADLAGAPTWRRTLSIFGVSYRGVIGQLLNMLTLYWLGRAVEKRLDQRKYIEMLVPCALVSMLGILMVGWGTSSIGCGYSGKRTY